MNSSGRVNFGRKRAHRAHQAGRLRFHDLWHLSWRTFCGNFHLYIHKLFGLVTQLCCVLCPIDFLHAPANAMYDRRACFDFGFDFDAFLCSWRLFIECRLHTNNNTVAHRLPPLTWPIVNFKCITCTRRHAKLYINIFLSIAAPLRHTVYAMCSMCAQWFCNRSVGHVHCIHTN